MLSLSKQTRATSAGEGAGDPKLATDFLQCGADQVGRGGVGFELFGGGGDGAVQPGSGGAKFSE